MPRPARYALDEILDAAAELLAAHGPAAVTMSAVARTVGAPSGSMYHRFPTRAALCGELWIRTEGRFQAGFLKALNSSTHTQTRGVAAALFTIRWCRDNRDEARVLLVGAEALDQALWPQPLTDRREPLRRRVDRDLAGVDVDQERLRAAVIDVPYAVVRRYLVAQQMIPDSADAIVEDCARVLLT